MDRMNTNIASNLASEVNSTALSRPLCVSYGMGVDSTALLVGLQQRGIRPDVITFADTGGEHPDTYAYLPVINAWLRSIGFPEVTVVRYEGKHGRYNTLEGNCLANNTLGKACSQKFKRDPQNKYRKSLPLIRDAWKRGEKALVAIGYDAGPKDARRSALASDNRYEYIYPLRQWGWDRERCQQEIATAGLPVPRKSACFFCPSNKPAEIAELVDNHPELADRIIAMEEGAAPKLTKIQGLWRNGTKGTRGAEKKPGAMSVFIRERRALAVVQPVDTSACEGCGGA